MPEAIRFGASISTSGRYSLQGRQALAGLQAWAKATNVEGGVRISQLGGTLPIALIHYDDASSSERAMAAAEKASSEERGAFLAEACGDDGELRRRVEGLLEAHDASGGWLGSCPCATSSAGFADAGVGKDGAADLFDGCSLDIISLLLSSGGGNPFDSRSK